MGTRKPNTISSFRLNNDYYLSHYILASNPPQQWLLFIGIYSRFESAPIKEYFRIYIGLIDYHWWKLSLLKLEEKKKWRFRTCDQSVMCFWIYRKIIDIILLALLLNGSRAGRWELVGTDCWRCAMWYGIITKSPGESRGFNYLIKGCQPDFSSDVNLIV